ncbi:MAG: FKBP-type peptidyl-prolyl cis-trans isomerase [Flavobacteriales bacterium]|nr:FKBP-type peptidyl-prolyl cis-trans isomerase [Flavobacteriales bacterium]
MNRFLFLALLVGGLTSCDTTDHPGFKRLEGTVHYRLIALGDDDRPVTEDSYVSMEVKAFSQTGQPLAQKRVLRIAFGNAVWPNRLKRLLLEAAQGDSLDVIGSVKELDANTWFEPIEMGADSDLLSLQVSVVEVLTAEEVLQSRAEERSANDRELNELALLKHAVDSLGFKDEDLQEGIFFRTLRPGLGSSRTSSGNEVLVRYKTWLADGQLIDDTFQGEALEYTIGKPDQVLLGFSKAIARMRVGAKALVILPADQAYGSCGSSSGIVPPYASLIYEVELVKVKQ